jgi:hypothetical protein
MLNYKTPLSASPAPTDTEHMVICEFQEFLKTSVMFILKLSLATHHLSLLLTKFVK